MADRDPYPSSARPLGDAGNAERIVKLFAEQFQNLLGRHPAKLLRFTSMAVAYLKHQPGLLQCDELSFALCLLKIAELGLTPGPQAGHAYLIPFSKGQQATKVCQLVPGYKGFVHCAYRSQMVADIQAGAVCAGDEFEYRLGSDPHLLHRPAESKGSAPYTHFWVVVRTLTALGAKAKRPIFGVLPKVLTVEDVLEFRERSKAYQQAKKNNRTDTPWLTDFGPMAMKTVLLRLTPWMPMSFEMSALLEVEADSAREDAIDVTAVDVKETFLRTGPKELPAPERDPMAEWQSRQPEPEPARQEAPRAAPRQARMSRTPAPPPRQAEASRAPPEPEPGLGEQVDYAPDEGPENPPTPPPRQPAANGIEHQKLLSLIFDAVAALNEKGIRTPLPPNYEKLPVPQLRAIKATLDAKLATA